jgi:hypothetical protein
VIGLADQTSLPTAFASVVIGEAMLSMQTTEHKRLIAAEAFRLLRSGGHYGIHELAVVPDDLPPDQQREIDRALISRLFRCDCGRKRLRLARYLPKKANTLLRKGQWEELAAEPFQGRRRRLVGRCSGIGVRRSKRMLPS